MFVKAISTLALAAVAIAQSLQINTPASLVTCQPAALSWSGGTAPYFVAVIPGGQSSAAALKDFGQQSGTSLTWTVDIAAGTSVSLKITDSTGNVNYNQAVTIQQGSTTSCIGAAASGSSAVSAASGSASSAASAASSAAMSSMGAVSSASAAVVGGASSARASVTSAAASVTSAAASGASAARSAAASGASNAASAASSAAASSGAASPFAVAPVTGFLAVVAAVVGVAF